MPRVAQGQAPGKVLLFGEHAVLAGEPALGFALSRQVEVNLEPGKGTATIDCPVAVDRARARGGATPQMFVQRVLGASARAYHADIHINFPPMAGFGSSAALAIALLRARSALSGKTLAAEALWREARRAEGLAHARSSGVDPALCLADGPIQFRRKGRSRVIQRIRVGKPAYLVVGARSSHGGARKTVQRVLDIRRGMPRLARQVLKTLGEATRAGRRALTAGQLESLGQAMNLAHALLDGLGIVSADVDELVRMARQNGAVGAKMSGAGGPGGAFVALAKTRKAAGRIRTRLSAQGAYAWIETI